MDKTNESERDLNSCEFFYYPHEHGASISINIDEPFNESLLFNEIAAIPNLQILGREVTHQSFGPIETWEDISTSLGILHFTATLEGFDDGYKISSGDKNLMELIVSKLRQSQHFHERTKS